MNKKAFRFLILLSFTFACVASLQAQSDPNTLLLQSVDAKNYSGSNTVIVYDSTDVDVMDTGLSYVLMHKLTKVLTYAGAKDLRTITYNYDPLSAAVEVRLVRIYRKDGNIEKINSDRFIDYPAPARAIYWGAREKLVDIGRLEPGDAVETIIFRKGFTYALLADQDDDSKFIPPMRGHFYDIVEFFSSVPVIEKVYKVSIPKNKPLQYEVYNGDVTSSIHFARESDKIVLVETNPHVKVIPQQSVTNNSQQNISGKTIYCWSRRNIQPFKSEPQMVATSDVATKLLLSTSPDWYAKSVWFNKVNEDYKSFDVTPEVQSITNKLLKGVTDEMEKISTLTHWAAEEIRYSGISMGTGEGYTLHPGSMTFLDRCGVCKDKAGMLITLLRAAGFESYPAMTMAGSRIDHIPADQFNHSVTVVKRKNGNWMLLDPTWVPGVRELWSSAEQQQEFLMGIPGGADLMTTPISPAENHYWKLNGASTLKDDGTLEGSFELIAEGQSDASARRIFQRSFLSQWKEYLPRVMYDVSSKAKIVEQKFSDPNDLSAPIKISVNYLIPDYATMTNEKILFVPLLAKNPFSDGNMSSEMYTDTSITKRGYGFRMRCSKLTEVNETITLPKFKKVVLLPEFNSTKSSSANFDAKYSLNGNTLKLYSTHRMEKRIYEASDWTDFRTALIERMKLTQSPIVLAK